MVQVEVGTGVAVGTVALVGVAEEEEGDVGVIEEVGEAVGVSLVDAVGEGVGVWEGDVPLTSVGVGVASFPGSVAMAVKVPATAVSTMPGARTVPSLGALMVDR